MTASLESLQLLAELHQSADALRQQALGVAYQRYFLRMIEMLRKRLPANLRQRVDAEDLAQSAWGNFLHAFQEGRINLDSRESLWPLLACIAIRKYHNVVTRARMQKRDPAREQSLDANRRGEMVWEPLGSEPSPYEEVATRETTELIAAQLHDDEQRRILSLRLDGYLVEEIAGAVDLSQRTVKRVLEKIREVYHKLDDVAPKSGNSTLSE